VGRTGPKTCVLGIDPGLAATGYAVLEGGAAGCYRLLEGGVIATRPRLPLEERLGQLHAGLWKAVRSFELAAVAVEELYAGSVNPKTALLMAHARGVCLLAAGQAGIPVYHYPATSIKQSVTGLGRASKAQVQKMIQVVLKLDSPPRPDHVADAIAVAICHLTHTFGRGSFS